MSEKNDQKREQVFIHPSQLASTDSGYKKINEAASFFPFPIYWVDKRGVIVGSNVFFRNLIGDASSVDLIGKTMDEIYFQEEIEAIEVCHQKVMQNQNVISREEVVRNKTTGNLSYLKSLKVPLYDNSQNVIGLVNTSIDVTFEKNNLDAQKDKVIFDHLKKVAQIIPVPMYWLSLDQQYLGVNDLVIEETGTESYEKDFAGKTPYDVFPWEMAHNIVLHHQEVIKKKKTFFNEEIAKDTKGNVKYYNATIAPFYDDRGDLIGTVGVSINITAQREAEKKLLDTNKKLSRANEAKSEFIANMSHDLRTPMTGVLGMLDGLLFAMEDAESAMQSDSKLSLEKLQSVLEELVGRVREYVNIAKDSTNELMQLFSQILEAVRLESGKVKTIPKAFDLYALVKRDIDLLRAVAEHKKLKLSLDIDQRIPRYLIGLDQFLDRTLLNLISNALKFTESGFVKVSVCFVDDPVSSYKRGDHLTLQIRVEDSGIGIPPDKFDEIFEHFSRLTASYHGVYKGSGLGLYTVKRYLEAMQGDIVVESNVGKGTCFTLTVPFVVDGNHLDQAAKKSTQGIRKKSVSPAEFDNEIMSEVLKARVLVVEDQPIAAMSVRMLLERLGCEVELANSGVQAIEKVRTNAYGLIFMDVGLPDITGLEAAQKIRALSDVKKSQVPIVALTGHMTEEKRQECLDAGMNDVLSKPPESATLQSILQHWLSTNEELNQSPEPSGLSGSERLPIIDWEGCLSRFNYDAEVAQRMMSILVKDLKEKQKLLAKAYAKKEMEFLRFELHACLGNVVCFQLPQLEHALKDFQTAIKIEPQDPQQLETTYAALQEAMEAFFTFYEKQSF